ncbi:MAG: radical SAM family heme chaperone HemW [Chromatiaceae bacterium]|nr:radical SAM family heme chaperone HemW [Chromatiaceae bacterium]
MTKPILFTTDGLGTIPPLSLYVHVPWCVRKCPYCDFNSHPRRGDIPEAAYVDRLLCDLEQDRTALSISRPLISVFIGGGTPSLFSGDTIGRLVRGVGELIELPADAEITLETNPGTADAERFAAYRDAGVNRLSIGAQSLSGKHLQLIGRIHGPEEVHAAVELARRAGFRNLNLDLMYGLPEQSLAEARRDLEEALSLAPTHVSYYQLTLEPNTDFHRAPPTLPDADLIADMHLQGAQILASKGFEQYEVSAHAQAGHRCRHNLNYWKFGDYLGIGAGAHGKLTDPARHRIERRWKRRHPATYLLPPQRCRLVSGTRLLSDEDLVLEFAMNALRLVEGFDLRLFERRTGLPFDRIAGRIAKICSAGLLLREANRVMPTELGRRFLDDLVACFAQD